MSKGQLNQLINPTLTDLLDSTKENTASQLNCVQVGSINAFYPETQTADIELVLRRVTSINPDGSYIAQQLPLLLTCPVMTLFGGNAFLSMPIAAGDNCIVLFNDREMQQWFNNGGVQTPVTYRTHDLSDAMAIVGIRSLQDSIADYLVAGIRLSYSENSRMSFTDNQIETIAGLFKQNGNMLITGNLTIQGGLEVDGTVTGTGGTGAIDINANITLHSGKTLSGGVLQSSNGATGSFANVVVVNGIVVSGT